MRKTSSKGFGFEILGIAVGLSGSGVFLGLLLLVLLDCGMCYGRKRVVGRVGGGVQRR